MDKDISEKLFEHISIESIFQSETKKDIIYMKESLARIEDYISQVVEKKEEEHKEINTRITLLENWKIQFVAKFSVYASVALFLGSIIGQLLIKWVDSKI